MKNISFLLLVLLVILPSAQNLRAHEKQDESATKIDHIKREVARLGVGFQGTGHN